MKTLLGGAIGGLTGFLVSHFIVTYKQVKKEMQEREELVNDLNLFVAESAVTAEALKTTADVANEVSHTLKTRKRKFKEPENPVIDLEDMSIDPAIVDISEVEAAALNAEEQEAEDSYVRVEKNIMDLKEVREILKDYGEDVDYLKHNPDSDKALIQFKASRLAEVNEGPAFLTLMELFNHPFNPVSTDDEIVKQHILEARAEFFGPESIHASKATMAELYLHFAELMSQDFDESLDHFVSELIFQSELDVRDGGDETWRKSHQITIHDADSKFGFGMFALHKEDAGYGTHSFMAQYNSCRYFKEDY